tara:strand:+ start:315 stop:1358 length:1044 start_codon:yes stop_codon:yes gene_type:complete
MSDIKVNNITSRDGNAGPIIAGVSTVASTGFMIMPSGDTAIRGAGSGRGLFAMGLRHPSSVVTGTDLIQISTTGNGTDFGQLTEGRMQTQGGGNSIRGVFGGGLVPPNNVTTIDYVVMSSAGGGNDFGELTLARRTFVNGASSNSTIAIFGSGYISTNQNTMDFVNIMTTGDANDFGDLVNPKQRDSGACASPTRAIFAGGVGDDPSGIAAREIHFVNFASRGNSEIFAALTTRKFGTAGASNSTRAVFSGGGGPAPSYTNTNTIDFITMATGGEATDFGDMSQTRRDVYVASSATRGVFGGGYTPTIVNVIDYITIPTTGDATDFGDMQETKRTGASTSDVHGGLG